MASDQKRKNGLYWMPRGGNNAKDIWASCHTFTSVTENKETGAEEKQTIIVDIGQHEVPKAFANGSFDKVVPALDDCLDVPGAVQAENPAAAIFLTHCHSDHISGIYEYLHMGVKLPPVYASEYTLNALEKGLFDNGIDRKSWPEMKKIEAGDNVRIGEMNIDVFPASHSVPGCFSFKISNQDASIFHSGDTKADETSFLGKGVDLSSYRKIAENGGVDLMTFDATATHLKGHASYESEIFDTYARLFKENKDRQIVATLPAAHMERFASVVCAAHAAGKHVVVDGGASMDSNILALQLAGYDLRKECPGIQIVGPKGAQAQNLNPKDCVTITTGIYMEKNSPFVTFLKGQDSHFVLEKNAVVITPSCGDSNEKLTVLLKRAPELLGVSVITGLEEPRIYGSGHAQQDDFKKIVANICPKVVTPIHCSSRKAEIFKEVADKCGYKTLDQYAHNGTMVQVNAQDGCRIVSVADPHWYGLNHKKNKDGLSTVVFSKVGDNGYSISSDRTKLEARQKQAYQKITDYYRRKNVVNTETILNRRGYGR